jgi:putative copper export protein
MRRDIDDSLREILKRSDRIRREREKRLIRGMTSACVVLLVALTACISIFSGSGGSPVSESVYGSFLLSAEAGGYVLVAVLAFICGIIASVLAEKIRKKKNS